jgi:hypothetical protein
VRVARNHDCTVAEVNAALDRHPIELDRDRFLRRTLALELHRLDEQQGTPRLARSWSRSTSGAPRCSG